MSEDNGHHGEKVIEEIRSLEIPPGWARASVGAAGDVRLGRQRSPKNRSAEFPTKYVRAANITWTGLDLSDVLDMDFRPNELASYRLQPGDVLLSEASGSAGEVGKPAIWNGELENCCFQNTVIRFRPKAVSSKFALIAFQHFARNSFFARVSKGVGIHHLSADRFASMPFLLPPKEEQRRIVAKIEELFSDLDAGVAALRRAKANLKRYRAAVLKAAVEGKLTEAWRSEHPDTEPASQLLARILTERRQKWETDQLAKFAAAGKELPRNWRERYVEPTRPVTTGLPELPEGWCWVTANQLCSQITDGEHIQPPYQEEGFPMLTATHVRNGHVEFKKVGYISESDFRRCLQRCAPTQGDILIVSVGATTGRAGIVQECPPFALVRSVLVLKPIRSGSFLLEWIQSPWCQNWIGRASGATAQAHYYIADTKRMPVPLPSEDEQSVIVDQVDRCLSIISAAESQIEHGLLRAARLRQSILKQAFEGKLVTQDPKDEPASVLLERLRVSQPAHGGNGEVASPARMLGRRAKSKQAVEFIEKQPDQ